MMEAIRDENDLFNSGKFGMQTTSPACPPRVRSSLDQPCNSNKNMKYWKGRHIGHVPAKDKNIYSLLILKGENLAM